MFITMALVMARGILFGMVVRIDKAGRVVVPKPLRERLRLTPDTELEAIERPEGLLLKRLEQSPSMVKIDGLWVHQGAAEPGANWDRVIDDLREERIESVLKA
jgi:AbrB family looped-hinge helix DNA binding protein